MNETRAVTLRAMHKAGLRLDDAGTAADVAIRILRDQRDRAIVAARQAGLTYRHIAGIFDVTHPLVIRVVTRAAAKLPADSRTMNLRPAGQAAGHSSGEVSRTESPNNPGIGGAG